MRVTCPHCQLAIRAPAEAAGRVATCGRCKGRFEVPIPRAKEIPNPEVTVPSTPDIQSPPAAPSGTLRIQERRPIVTEQTAKKWKLVQLIGVAGTIFFSALMFAAMALPRANASRYLAIVAIVASLCIYMLGRVGAWWHHG